MEVTGRCLRAWALHDFAFLVDIDVYAIVLPTLCRRFDRWINVMCICMYRRKHGHLQDGPTSRFLRRLKWEGEASRIHCSPTYHYMDLKCGAATARLILGI